MNRSERQRLRRWVRERRLSAAEAEDVLFLYEKFEGRRSLDAIVLARGYLDAAVLEAEAETTEPRHRTGSAPIETGDFEAPGPDATLIAEGTLIVRSPLLASPEPEPEPEPERAEPESAEPESEEEERVLESGDAAEAVTLYEAQLPPDLGAALRTEIEDAPTPSDVDPHPRGAGPRPAEERSTAGRSVRGSAPAEEPPLPLWPRRVAGPRGARVDAAPSLPSPVGAPPAEAPALSGYRVEGLIARGERASVYRARDLARERSVAIRVFEGAPELVEAEVERVAPKLLVAARLAHAQLVRPLDLGRSDGRRFVAFEHVEGLTLEERLTAESRLPLLAALEIGRDVARALGAIHAAGEVHGDLRPDRVFLDRAGPARLAGFGLDPAPLPPAERSWTATLPAPERAWGAPPSPATDLYALGGLLHLMLTGAPPFDATDARALTDALDRGAPDVRDARPEVPQRVARLIASLLEPSAERRPRSAADVADWLARAAVVSEGEGGALESGRLRLRWGVIGAAAALGLASIVVLGSALALVSSDGGRSASTGLGCLAFAAALLLGGVLELMRQGQVPLALGAAWWVRARDGLGLAASALLLAGGIGPRAAGLDLALAAAGAATGLAWSLGWALRSEIARARPDRGRGRTLAVLGDVRLRRWRRHALPAFAGVVALTGLRWLLLAYFTSPAAQIWSG